MTRADNPLRHHAHRLVRWQRLALYITGAWLLATGSAWLLLHYSLGAGELPHPLEAWSLRLHGLAAFAGLFVLGLLAAAHIPQGWRLSHRRRWAGQRRSGVLLCVIGALLSRAGRCHLERASVRWCRRRASPRNHPRKTRTFQDSCHHSCPLRDEARASGAKTKAW